MSAQPRELPAPQLYDMHCHPGFAVDPRRFAEQAQAAGVGLFANTVCVGEYQRVSRMLAGCANVRVGVGMHPWWIDSGRTGAADVDELLLIADEQAIVGEVGLDFAPRRESSRDEQLQCFSRVVRGCADRGGVVMSIHAVRSATAVLDELQAVDFCGRGVAVMHWFSGSSDELHRAVQMGCLFSVGKRSLATKRGRAYVRAIPAQQLLLETDLPAEQGDNLTGEQVAGELRETLETMASLRSCDPTELAATLAATSAALLAR